MARIVCVHGIGQQYKAEDVLAKVWVPALRGGLRRSGAAGVAAAGALGDADITCVFYGDLFRPPGRWLGPGDEWLTAEDATADDAELLRAWWQEAASTDPAVLGPDARTLLRTPSPVQAALNALSGSAFFAGVTDRMLLGDAAQVRRYLAEPGTRAAARERVAAQVTDATEVLVAHSLGSVVAYEALCEHPEWGVRALVTLGSPLGIANLIFERLQPEPQPKGTGDPRGSWPGSIADWTNIADRGDVVALVKELAPLFGARVRDLPVHNGSKAHAVEPYLTAQETGTAILAGLSDPSGPR